MPTASSPLHLPSLYSAYTSTTCSQSQVQPITACHAKLQEISDLCIKFFHYIKNTSNFLHFMAQRLVRVPVRVWSTQIPAFLSSAGSNSLRRPKEVVWGELAHCCNLNSPTLSSIRHSREAILANTPRDSWLRVSATTFALSGW